MSPRAACRLEQLGFGEVFDFVAGKAAWMAAGLPVDGSRADDRASTITRVAVPICRIDDTLADVPAAARDWGVCVVCDPGGCVLGEIRAGELGRGPEVRVSEVMQNGPATARPSMPVTEIRDHFAKGHATHVLVTTLDGRLVGLVRRDDVDAAVSGSGE
jgi:CBS domain-containing protein